MVLSLSAADELQSSRCLWFYLSDLAESIGHEMVVVRRASPRGLADLVGGGSAQADGAAVAPLVPNRSNSRGGGWMTPSVKGRLMGPIGCVSRGRIVRW